MVWAWFQKLLYPAPQSLLKGSGPTAPRDKGEVAAAQAPLWGSKDQGRMDGAPPREYLQQGGLQPPRLYPSFCLLASGTAG